MTTVATTIVPIDCSQCENTLFEGTKEQCEAWLKRNYRDNGMSEWMEEEQVYSSMCDYCSYVYFKL